MSAFAFFTAVALYAFFAFEVPEPGEQKDPKNAVVAEQSASEGGDRWSPQ